MIALRNVSHFVPGTRRTRAILRNVTLSVAPGERIGVLASAGSGKSSLARILAGIDLPDAGQVTISGRVSWPLGFAGFLHPHLSPRANLQTIARLTGQKAERLIQFCQNFTGLSERFGRQTIELSPTERAALSYAVSMGLPFDMLIVDEQLTVGEAPMRAKCEALIEDRLRHAGLIFISRNPRQLAAHCDRNFVLLNQKLVPVTDLEAARDALDMAAGHIHPEEVLEHAG